MFFVNLFHQFLCSFEGRKLRKTYKFKLGDEIRMQMSFWTSPERFFYLLEGFLGRLLLAQGLPRGCLGIPGLPPIRAKLGSRRPEARKSQGSFLPSELQSPSGPILEPFYVDFHDFLTFYQAKVQFPLKKHHFYLHNSHVRCLLCR